MISKKLPPLRPSYMCYARKGDRLKTTSPSFATGEQTRNGTLWFQFRLGLSDSIKDELARVGVPESQEALFKLVV